MYLLYSFHKCAFKRNPRIQNYKWLLTSWNWNYMWLPTSQKGWALTQITWVGSTSPWIMFSIDMYFAWLASFVRAEETMMFFVCQVKQHKNLSHMCKTNFKRFPLAWRSLLITSSTVVLRITLACRKKFPCISLQFWLFWRKK